ncbi:MAG: DedA family protein [Bacteroidetes bacterium]|nr:DedA family protein [Bacteroidota bacterium]
MIENTLDFISSLSPFWIYVALFGFSFIENIFPPTPSDLIIVIGGSLIATHSIHFVPTLFLTTAGSVIGFMGLFYFGSQLDKKVVRAGKIKFISIESLDKLEHWFLKYGYFIILGNRFLPGIRSLISFFAGLSELDFKKTTILALISSFTWNAGIIYLGIIFGKNVHQVDKLLSTYSKTVIVIILLILIFYILKYIFQMKEKNKK